MTHFKKPNKFKQFFCTHENNSYLLIQRTTLEPSDSEEVVIGVRLICSKCGKIEDTLYNI